MPIHQHNRHKFVVNVLRVVWVLLTIWYEFGTFLYHAHSCPWPDQTLRSDTTPSHLLLIADPQILDHRSYPSRGPLLTWLTRIIVDLNLRKNWHASLRTSPDAVVFVGDMMDGGRVAMADSEFLSYQSRFYNIFKSPPTLPRYFIPGNHDVGLGISDWFSPHARPRYLSTFGPLNQQLSFSNHTLLLIDAPGLVDEDNRRHWSGKSYAEWQAEPNGPLDYVTHASKASPTILITHIPLFRPEESDCGPYREKGTIRQGGGVGYQNMLGSQLTEFVLQEIRPVLVFSGDDHDYCEYTHITNAAELALSTKEISIKSLSMAMGIRRPGFQMLSLIPPNNDGASFADTPCFMPDQLRIYLSIYLPLALFSIFIIALSNGNTQCLRSAPRSGFDDGPFQLRKAPKDDRRRYSDEFPSEVDSGILPVPASARHPKETNSHSTTYLRRLCGILQVPKLFLISSARRRRGVVRGTMQDVVAVAVFPLSIIVGISVWMFL